MPPYVVLVYVVNMVKHLDTNIKNGVKDDVYIDRHSQTSGKVIINTTQDVEPILNENAIMRDATRGLKKESGRVIADIPKVIIDNWKNMYGFDIYSPLKSNWGYGMTKEQHKAMLRKLLNLNPALKTVDERL